MQTRIKISADKKILVVDDDPRIAEMLVRVYSPYGYQISVAADGREALFRTRRELPDLIVLDLGLPRMPGEEVCKEIRKDQTLKHIPIIMLTGKCRDSDKIVGKVIGADYYMTKPCDLDELLHTSQDILFPPSNS